MTCILSYLAMTEKKKHAMLFSSILIEWRGILLKCYIMLVRKLTLKYEIQKFHKESTFKRIFLTFFFYQFKNTRLQIPEYTIVYIIGKIYMLLPMQFWHNNWAPHWNKQLADKLYDRPWNQKQFLGLQGVLYELSF